MERFPRPELWRVSDYYAVCELSAVKSRIKDLYQQCSLDAAQWKNFCLYNAAGHGYFSVCEYLVLKERADPTAKFQKGQTAVHNAARCGHFPILRLFLETHGSLAPTDDNGYTPLAWAYRAGHKRCQDLLANVAKQHSNEPTAAVRKICGGPVMAFRDEVTYIASEEQENTVHSSSEAALLLNRPTTCTGSSRKYGRSLSRRETIEMEMV